MTVRSITFSDLISDASFGELRDKFFEECRRPFWGEVRPDYQAYLAMEGQGLLDVFGAFAGEKLVGFAIVMRTRSLVTGQEFRSVDCLFILPQFRDDQSGLLLRRALEQEEGGAVLISAAHGSSLAAALSKDRRHFIPVEVIYQFRRQ